MPLASTRGSWLPLRERRKSEGTEVATREECNVGEPDLSSRQAVGMGDLGRSNLPPTHAVLAQPSPPRETGSGGAAEPPARFRYHPRPQPCRRDGFQGLSRPVPPLWASVPLHGEP